MKTAVLSLALVAACQARNFKLQHSDLVTLSAEASLRSNTTSCGAFQNAANVTESSYDSATGIFTVPKVSSRAAYDWASRTMVSPRIIISVGIDGIVCPETVRAGTYSTVCSLTHKIPNWPYS